MRPPRPLAVTMGDPAGIGLDIVLAAWGARGACALPPFVLFADPDAVAERAHTLGVAVQLRCVDRIGDARPAASGELALRPVPLAVQAIAGQPDTRNAPGIIAAIELATAAVVAGAAAAVVTNPIAKATLTAAGFKHPGHTEFLAELAGRHEPGRQFTPVMMLASETLRVVPLTIHIPLRDVPVVGSNRPELVSSTCRYSRLNVGS